jgi:hypothetical protein
MCYELIRLSLRLHWPTLVDTSREQVDNIVSIPRADSKPYECCTRSADLPTQTENAISILFDSLSSAYDLQLPPGMEAARADATDFDLSNLAATSQAATRSTTFVTP